VEEEEPEHTISIPDLLKTFSPSSSVAEEEHQDFPSVDLEVMEVMEVMVEMTMKTSEDSQVEEYRSISEAEVAWAVWAEDHEKKSLS